MRTARAKPKAANEWSTKYPKKNETERLRASTPLTAKVNDRVGCNSRFFVFLVYFVDHSFLNLNLPAPQLMRF